MAENGLLFHDSMSEWREQYADHPHFWPGALRTVAELLCGGLDARAVAQADRLLRESHGPSTEIVLSLADAAAPRLLVDKSPLELPTGRQFDSLAARWPEARFLHLVRHPHESIRSMMEYPSSRAWASGSMAALAPLMWWSAHQGAARLRSRLPAEQSAVVRSEEVLRDPAGTLGPVLAAWDLRADESALEALAHPQRASIARRPDLGGADPAFLASPQLRPRNDPPRRITPDGAVSSPALDRQIAALAESFGYDVG